MALGGGATFGGAATRFAGAFFAALRFAFGAAFFTAFLATFRAPPDFFALAGRAFFFATLFLAAGRLALAAGRFFDLLFFAMITLLLEIVRTHRESSPEKACCHLCVMLESVGGIAYAARVLPNEPISPLKDVWLRPRRVFREIASRPVGTTDYLLAAAQGVGNFLALYRTEGAGAHLGVDEILVRSFLYGAIAGIASLFLMGVIYTRLGKRAGGKSTTGSVIHVLAYGSVPMVASLAIWVVTALLVGEATFVVAPREDLEGFLVLLLRLQFAAYLLLIVWSIVLQVMGFSEIQGLATRKALGIWVLGQIIGVLASLFLAILLQLLFPGALLSIIPQD
jgi:Yip1 domain